MTLDNINAQCLNDSVLALMGQHIPAHRPGARPMQLQDDGDGPRLRSLPGHLSCRQLT